MAAPAEPRNPFYLMLLIAGLVFIVTVLAYVLVPWMEEKAKDAGAFVPPREDSWFRNGLHKDGWKWVLGEVAVLVVLGLASMGLDRYRRWKTESQISAQNPDTTKVETPPPT
ncbi:MAG: hypothetical protein EXR98_14260 [Gemmataceae bacterium]|nr:hypothetical protein [Gemmataceae bacterium]